MTQAQKAITVREASHAIKEFLEARTSELAKALPSHIRPEHFQRVALTAISNNPDLLGVDLRSLWNAIIRCAQDGLIPDGQEAALVTFGDKAGYIRMVLGYRKLVQQSGEITNFYQRIAYQNDPVFEVEYGDHERIRHKPFKGAERGTPIAVYSVAVYKNGARSLEVMWHDEIEKIRSYSRYANGSPWRNHWGEMARKTVARRHCKILPMSSDAIGAIEREDALDHVIPGPAHDHSKLRDAGSVGRPRLAAQLDQLATDTGMPADMPAAAREFEQPRRPRGRPRKNPPAAPAANDNPDSGDPRVPWETAGSANEFAGDADFAAHAFDEVDEMTGEMIDTGPADAVPAGDKVEDQAANDNEASDPDWQRGYSDAKSGAQRCLSSAIRENPARLDRWRAGWHHWHQENPPAA